MGNELSRKVGILDRILKELTEQQICELMQTNETLQEALVFSLFAERC